MGPARNPVGPNRLLSRMKVLVTGGSGFIGRHIVPRLVDEGFEVSVLARHANRTARGARFVAGDIADATSLAAAVDAMDAVLHLVAIITERGSQTFDRVNVRGTTGLLDAMAAPDVPRIVPLTALGPGPHP